VAVAPKIAPTWEEKALLLALEQDWVVQPWEVAVWQKGAHQEGQERTTQILIQTVLLLLIQLSQAFSLFWQHLKP
jgi:hypothetical protein